MNRYRRRSFVPSGWLQDKPSHGTVCAHPACGLSIKPGLLMCGPHWHRLPKPIQRAVLDTWRALNEAKTHEAIAAYRTARENAINWFQQKGQQP